MNARLSSARTIRSRTMRVRASSVISTGGPKARPAHRESAAAPHRSASVPSFHHPCWCLLMRSGCHGIVEVGEKRVVTPIALGEAQRFDSLDTYLSGVRRALQYFHGFGYELL